MSPPGGTVAAVRRTSCVWVCACGCGASGAATIAVIPTAATLDATPACRLVNKRMVLLRMGSVIGGTERGRRGFITVSRPYERRLRTATLVPTAATPSCAAPQHFPQTTGPEEMGINPRTNG